MINITTCLADVRAQVGLSLFTDFENFRVFKPAAHQESSINTMLDQVITWSGARSKRYVYVIQKTLFYKIIYYAEPTNDWQYQPRSIAR